MTESTKKNQAESAKNVKAEDVLDVKFANPKTCETEFRAVLVSLSGNVGKTTIARHLLMPRMEGVEEIIYIESANADNESQEGQMVRAAQFEKVAINMMESVSAIIDVGASNVEETLELMRQIDGSHEDIDYIIVPIVKSPKQRKDSIKTVHQLIKMGVDRSKIKPVYNRVSVVENPREEFADVIYAFEQMGIPYNDKAVIHESNFFPRFQERNLTLDELFEVSVDDNKARQNDLRRMKNRTDEETAEMRNLSELVTLQRNAITATTNLDDVYEALFSK